MTVPAAIAAFSLTAAPFFQLLVTSNVGQTFFT